MISTGDTIVAISSPPGVGARAILRASGALALVGVESLLPSGERLCFACGFTGHATTLEIDGLRLRVWISFFRCPRSYTGEDLVEVHTPSSPPVVAALARALVVRDGIRWAAPGEFTLRAFLAGRIDLSQAESVDQLIRATDETEARAARRGLAGELGVRVRSIARQLTESVALLEASLDFADEDLPEIDSDTVLERLRAIGRDIRSLRSSTSLRLSPRGVLHVVIAGFPNAGKSSLLNALLGWPAALVSPFAGTTRDPVRGRTSFRGIEVEWVDVAGREAVELGEVSDGDTGSVPELERLLAPEGREALARLTRTEMENADVVVWVVDPVSDAERSMEAFESLRGASVLVVNKKDLLDKKAREKWRRRVGDRGALVSAVRGDGIAGLVKLVTARRRRDDGSRPGAAGAEPRFLVSAHQEAALLASAEAVDRALSAVEAEIGYECVSADLRDALRALEDLTGQVTADEILGCVFSRFCIGK